MAHELESMKIASVAHHTPHHPWGLACGHQQSRPESTRDVFFNDLPELRRTAGKKGTPPLKAMPEEDGHPDHGDLRLVTRRRPMSLAVRVQTILDNAVEYAWQALAEDRSLDPLTVGVCKRLHDWERGLWPSR